MPEIDNLFFRFLVKVTKNSKNGMNLTIDKKIQYFFTNKKGTNLYLVNNNVSCDEPTKIGHFFMQQNDLKTSVYYSTLISLGEKSQYISIKFPFYKSLKMLCCATNQDSLLLATLR